MSVSLVLTVIGKDRPGLVEALSEVISRHEANWQASHMARLGGRFAGILEVSVPAGKAEALSTALGQIAGLTVSAESAGRAETIDDWVGFEIDLVGNDRPGIIREIAHSLARRGATVVELTSSREPAPMSGGALFRMRAEVRCPEGMDRRELREALESIAHELMVDIDLRDD
jgi:glycine cleavage system regulatory protein